MKQWNELSAGTLEVMKELGSFGPTTRGDEIKGYQDGDKVYWDAKDLKDISAACLEVAQWLEERK